MKDFDRRNSIKKRIDRNEPTFHILPREIWFTYLGLNVGTEENGKGKEYRRPVLVLKKIGSLFLILPLTTGGKDSYYYHRLPDSYFNKRSRIILSQLRTLGKARFIHKVCTLASHDFQEIQKKLKALML